MSLSLTLSHCVCLWFYRWRGGPGPPRVVLQPAALAQLPQAHLRTAQPQDRGARWPLAHPRVLLAGPELPYSGEWRVETALIFYI